MTVVRNLLVHPQEQRVVDVEGLHVVPSVVTGRELRGKGLLYAERLAVAHVTRQKYLQIHIINYYQQEMFFTIEEVFNLFFFQSVFKCSEYIITIFKITH